VALKPDVIVVGSDDCILAVHKVTQTILVVGVGLSFDLLDLGLIASRARPGGYVTGFDLAITGNLRGKRVSLLKEMAPRITRIGMVYNPDEFGTRSWRDHSTAELVGALLISLLALAAPVAALGVVIFFLWPRNASDPSSLSKRAAGQPDLAWTGQSSLPCYF
jgi:hypothetical protein